MSDSVTSNWKAKKIKYSLIRATERQSRLLELRMSKTSDTSPTNALQRELGSCLKTFWTFTSDVSLAQMGGSECQRDHTQNSENSISSPLID